MTKLNRKLTKFELNDVFSVANNKYRDLHKGDLTDHQFKSMCFVDAVCTVLNIQGVDFPERKNCEPVED